MGNGKEKEAMKLKKVKILLDNNGEFTPMLYVTSQWQSGNKSVPYFIYRLVCFVWFIEALILSFIQVKYTMEYWPIYYTHWSFLLATAQSTIALVLVAMNQADAFNPNGGRIQNRVCKVYEFVHAAAVTQAFAVTILYWGAVYDPKNGWPNVQTIQVHAVNSVAMLLDLCLVAFPMRMITFLLPAAVSVAYLLFNYIFYAAGGKGYDGKPYVYSVLDWDKPARAGMFSVIVTVLIFILFGFIWLISFGRRFIHSKCGTKRNMIVTQSQQQIHISTIA